jgi:hypothetical protein
LAAALEAARLEGEVYSPGGLREYFYIVDTFGARKVYNLFAAGLRGFSRVRSTCVYPRKPVAKVVAVYH